jgi:acyl-CoA thioesterase-1
MGPGVIRKAVIDARYVNILNLLIMKKVPAILVVLVSLAGAGCGSRQPRGDETDRADSRTATSAPAAPAAMERPAARARPRIVFLGDSLTAGLGLAPEESVPALVQKRLDAEGYEYEVVNAGVSGDTSAGGLSRLDWSLDGDVRVLVIELGGNDGLRGLPVAGMRRNLDEIITRAKKRGVDVLLTGMEAPPSHGEAYTADFRQTFRDLAREHEVAFMPFFLEGVAGIDALNQGDRIHPNPDGARLIERKIWGSLEPLLDARD